MFDASLHTCYNGTVMHELSVTESLPELALRHAQEAEAKRILHLHLVIGQLSSIVDDSVQFYWDIISKDTAAEGAVLHFKRIPALMLCLDCGNKYHPQGNLICPACKGSHVQVKDGNQFRLEAIDVE